MANAEACESFATEVRVQPNTPQKTTPKNLQTREKLQFAVKKGGKYGHLGRRIGGMRTSLQIWESIYNEISKILSKS